MTKIGKRFDGKNFAYYNSAPTKEEARGIAERARKYGFNARIAPGRYPTAGKYDIWVRGSKRKSS